ncbi:MAG: thioredoxin domain-containing protein [Puniceicoccaceae bacterium]
MLQTFWSLMLCLLGVTASMEASPNAPRANHLAGSHSLYLLQHQFNPVEWYPWGEAAFQKARDEGKPILVSIGYSTCHWCHVMERESFSNPAIAALLNESFVSIKVDREERPDIDRIYMMFMQSFSGSTGWPLNVFLTPELKPFFGVTYLPPEGESGQVGFADLLKRLANLWERDQSRLEQNADEMAARLREFTERERGFADGDPMQSIVKAVHAFQVQYDEEFGGFGPAPKFPMPSILSFLLQYAVVEGDESWMERLELTADQMAGGGLFDQVGGGFSRYAVDAAWSIPHFEKMLYDNAQLLEWYVDLYTVTGETRYLGVARRIAEYAMKHLLSETGAFYSAEDAESEGEEGRFYLWTEAELQQTLSVEAMEILKQYFEISPEGNFVNPHTGVSTGELILRRHQDSLSHGDFESLRDILDQLYRVREQRTRPRLDDKVLTAWNGLMIGAVAKYASVSEDDTFAAVARDAIAFLRKELWEPEERRLNLRWRKGHVDSFQWLNSYAYLLDGVLDAYETMLDPEYLQFAEELGQAMIARFYDQKSGGFWQTQSDGSQILELKDEHDGPEPAGNSVAVLALLKLAAITENEDYQAVVSQSLNHYQVALQERPDDLPYLLKARLWQQSPMTRVVISGEPGGVKHRELLRAVHRVYLPGKVVFGTDGGVEPFAQTLASEHAQVFVCHGRQCSLPVENPEEVHAVMRKGVVVEFATQGKPASTL